MDKKLYYSKIHENLTPQNEQTYPTVQTAQQNTNIPYNCSAFLSVNIK